MKYFIVFLDFDQSIVDIQEFDDEDAFLDAKAEAENHGDWPPALREWFSFSTWTREA